MSQSPEQGKPKSDPVPLADAYWPRHLIVMAGALVGLCVAFLLLRKLLNADPSQAAEMLKALAWPAVVVVALITLRKPLAQFVQEVGRRASKVSAFKVEIELATSKARELGQLSISELKEPTGSRWTESFQNQLLQQLASPVAADYALLDLGQGQEWITSRLFIFCVLLQRMRRLRCVVFLARDSDRVTRLVGWASPEAARWKLARYQPWLEAAYVIALRNQYPPGPNDAGADRFAVGREGAALDADAAKRVVDEFIRSLHRAAPEPGWVDLGGFWEHAEWADAELVRRVLDDALHDEPVREDLDAPHEQATKVLRRHGAFAAFVDDERRFRSLVDREALISKFVADQTQ